MENDWKKEAPLIALMEKRNPFTVPEGYFKTLQEQLDSRLYLLRLEKEDGLQNKFTVPEGYFDTLKAQIEGEIIAEELKTKITGNSFAVPEGYFNTLTDRINERISEPVKVVSFRSQKSPAWINYAAAACILVAVSTGLYFNIHNNTVNTPAESAFTQLSNVSDEEIIDYLQFSSTRADLPVLIENVGEQITTPTIGEDISSEDVQSYLNSL